MAGTRTKRLLARALTAVAVVLTLAVPATAEAANIGFNGPDFIAGVSGSPSGYKGESKLWFNDGFWWASMFDKNTSAYHIFKLDKATQTWTDTNVETDDRNSSRQDTLWDAAGGKLYVASHIFVENAGFNSTANQPMEFSRYSYNAGTYTKEFTVNIEPDERSESLVIDRGAGGTFWATWVQQPTAASGRQVMVSHTNGTCSDATQCVWLAPEQIGGAAIDDVSAVIRFGGSIGVMWSDQRVDGGEAYRFRVRGIGGWLATETATVGNKLADDHLSVKADAAGNVYAATKTKFLSAEKAQTRLLVRSAAGAWKPYLISPVSNSRTRPIVVLGEEHNTIHVYETGPHTTSSNGQSGGDIYEKVSRMDAISFAVSSARPVMRAEDPVDLLLNNSTSTKQSVTSDSDILALASTTTGSMVKTYWHHFDELVPGEAPPPPPPPVLPPPPPGGTPKGPCTITGTPDPDVIVGTAGADVICGLGGNDQISGLGGNDHIIGGPGKDVITGGAGVDLLKGGGGSDRLGGGAKADRLLGGSGNDKLLGGLGADRLSGGPGRDVLTGGAGSDRLVGGGGRDVYRGGGGNDTLVARDRLGELVHGGPGRDRARIDRGRDTPRSIEVLF